MSLGLEDYTKKLDQLVSLYPYEYGIENPFSLVWFMTSAKFTFPNSQLWVTQGDYKCAGVGVSKTLHVIVWMKAKKT